MKKWILPCSIIVLALCITYGLGWVLRPVATDLVSSGLLNEPVKIKHLMMAVVAIWILK